MSAKVTFTVTTHFRRPRSEPGLTQLGSQRIDAGRALGWILSALPDDSWEMHFEGEEPDGSAAKTTIVIDWAKVPAEVKDGTS